MFPKNAWYVAAMADEVGAERPLGRRICGAPLALWRDAQGVAHAVEDWCPHRGAPLSLGRVCDGALVCGYHGLAMGCDGRTVAMPGQRVRGFPPVRAFPLVERHGFLWVWPGEAALADPAAIHDCPWTAPGHADDWAFGGGLFHVKADYRLMIDNLMDLTHETYVHAGSIGQKEIDETPCETRVDGDVVTTRREMHGIIAPPFWQMALRGVGLDDQAPVDRWQICQFYPPSHVLIEVGVAQAGRGGFDAPPEAKASAVVVDFITPETETTMWYFWGMARRFAPRDAALTAQIREGQGRIFSEDIEMLERQQANLSAWPERALLKLNIDAGGVQSRRVLERWIAREQAPDGGAPRAGAGAAGGPAEAAVVAVPVAGPAQVPVRQAGGVGA
ncbi:aromatic ring-hydroxylating dioxygenase subunit alpha [Pseudaquabacterium rugosum]|uniref:Aromatic ring-hydroxylating dioxygenase subunit alpha n=1 Tax=Pseudaquabacterium rugosum TaxID=2984194 RepID=A0ABU9B670_9BURK